MDMKLELVPLPVTDVDRSIAFYRDQLGFSLDHDVQPGNGMRVVQLTPPGSACSIGFGTGWGSGTAPGSVRDLHLVVDSVEEARQLVLARGVEISEISDMGGVKYAFFADPDGNTWEFQEIPAHFR
ncbi:VOC family protein [Naasia aerilata]|uniref:Glyoxalase n=1 Tax=Naasia aerilata TaxID=1162966 RepID=A0ABM8GDL7_9MICO|nr:VOC family protein [Naasia aerilata]BDZ46367.1 glyoxalase [Naasia aerilata]